MAVLGSVLGVAGTVLYWLACAFGVLLAVAIVLLLVVLFVPAYVTIVYQNESLEVKAGMLCFTLRVYPECRFLRKNPEAKKAKKAAKKDVRKDEKKAVKLSDRIAAKGARATINALLSIVRAAGLAMRLILGALKIENICLRLPVQSGDPAQTAILYGKTNAWIYGSLAVLNNFLYLDFKEVQINPVFEENFERTAYFSCKVSAQLVIMVVVAFRLFQMLRNEKELLSFFAKGNPRSTVK